MITLNSRKQRCEAAAILGRRGGLHTNPAKRAGALRASLTAAVNRVRKHGGEPSAELLAKCAKAGVKV